MVSRKNQLEFLEFRVRSFGGNPEAVSGLLGFVHSADLPRIEQTSKTENQLSAEA